MPKKMPKDILKKKFQSDLTQNYLRKKCSTFCLVEVNFILNHLRII